MTAQLKVSSGITRKNRLPSWFKQELPSGAASRISRILTAFGARTVCQQAKCPNLNRCFRNKKITFLILGDTCSRSCRFCAVDKSVEPRLAQDESEPYRVSRLVDILGLSYVVITSVTRDDLSDGGAGSFARTISLIRGLNKNIKVEVLIPDFSADLRSLRVVARAQPCVIGHNLETVARLYPELKPQADYQRSLQVIGNIKKLAPGIITKSALMLGLGEKEEELMQAMRDLRLAKCDILTLGQYLAPSPGHYPLKRFIPQEQFRDYANRAYALGFRSVLSGPLVRSSFMAQSLYQGVVDA